MSGSKSQVANLEGDPLEELGEDGEVEDDGCGEERVLAGVVDDEGVVAAHGDLGGVLVHRALAVAHVRHVLDHHLQGRIKIRGVRRDRKSISKKGNKNVPILLNIRWVQRGRTSVSKWEMKRCPSYAKSGFG